MKKIVIFLCAVLILCSSCDKNSKFISVTGTGSVTFVPDLVKFSLTVRQTDPILANSVSKTKNEIVKILNICSKYGVKDEDIKSSWISTNQEFHWQTDKKVFDGYASNQTTDIIFRDLDKLEEFTAQLMKLDIANMNRMEFDHSDRTGFESEANLVALDNAKEAAEKMAKRMGVKLGDVLYISDSGVDYSGYREFSNAPMMYAKASGDSGGVVASPGILSVTRNVLVKFAIR